MIAKAKAISHEMADEMTVGKLYTPGGIEYIKLSSGGKDRDVWAFMNVPLSVGGRLIKLSDYATIEHRQTPPNIVKNNQEYILCIQYEYIGSHTQGQKLLDRVIKQYSKRCLWATSLSERPIHGRLAMMPAITSCSD